MSSVRLPLIDASLRRGLLGIAIAGALFALGFGIPMGFFGATSALVGAGLAAGNLIGIAYVVRGSLEGSVFSGLLGMTKIGLLFGATYVLIAKDVVGALPLAFGYASLPLGLTLGLGLRTAAPETAVDQSPAEPTDEPRS